MKVSIYSDRIIGELRSMRKQAVGRWSRWLEKPTGKPVHRQRSFKIKAIVADGQEYRFEIYERQNLRDESDFSCGIAHISLDGSRLTLARYNGPSHEHGEISFQSHIHLTSEKSIMSGRKPEHEASQTDRFETLDGALACMVEDFHITGIDAKRDTTGRLF